jgi:hypothetical protein
MFIENIIIGAGPAGLQAAYYFKKYNIEYVILEKDKLAGSFFNKYPHSGKLISINKKYTGKTDPDFNLRHDWNSLLNDEELLMGKYSDDYYPNREDLVKYLNDFAKNNNLNIIYDSIVESIDKTEDNYIITVKNEEKKYSCKKLIIATGLSNKNIPTLKLDIFDPIKHYSDYPTNFFREKKNLITFANKSVLILGGGNASFELGLILNEYASKIEIMNNSEYRKWALSTHYSGDLRSIYLPFMDTFLLKSLNAMDVYCKMPLITQKKSGDPYIINYITKYHNYYNIIIDCTGWKFDNSIFNFDLNLTNNKKYPEIKKNYESTNNNNLYFIGALMHSIDYRISSGGFIHGFRYLIKNFMNLNYNIPHKITEFKILNFEDMVTLANHILFRINTSSNIYQMFKFLGDVFYFVINTKTIIYYENVNINIEYEQEYDLKFIVTLEFGDKQITELYEIGKLHSCLGSESNASLLHPIIKIRSKLVTIDVVHFDEDLYAEFENNNKYYYKLLRTLKPYIL